jgi:uncharacterized membrane protein YcaP (DUF421 family)
LGIGLSRSVTDCTWAVITIGLLHTFVSWAKSRCPRFDAIVSEVLATARTNGLESLDQVAYAILERNGAISIIPKES